MSWLEEHKRDRMTKDAAKIRAPEIWPGYPVLHMKTQPWVTERERNMRFGIMHADKPLVVIPDGQEGDQRRWLVYHSVEDLVEVWSVD